MKIAICDDNAEHVSYMIEYLKNFNVKRLETDTFQSGEELLGAYKNNRAVYDVIFLDMEMGQLNGIETANFIRKIDNNVLIVFVTNYSQYMEKCFESSPFDFLIKPVKFEMFKKVFEKIIIRLSEKPNFFVFAEKKETIRIPCNEVVYFESQRHTLVVYKKDGSVHRTRKTLTDLINGIDTNTFVQIHRSYIVNISHIYKICENRVIVHGTDNYIPLSNTYKKNLNDAFMRYRERRYFI